MSDKSSPAGTTGGDTTTSTEAALAELPAKVRVHALAKLLSVSSKDVIAALADLGEAVRGAQSSVARETALRVAAALTGDAPWEGDAPADENHVEPEVVEAAVVETALTPEPARRIPPTPVFASASPLFLPPEAAPAKPARTPRPEPVEDEPAPVESDEHFDDGDDDEDGSGSRRRRRGRRGRGRGKGAADDTDQNDSEQPDKPEKPARAEAEQPADAEEPAESDADTDGDSDDDGDSGGSRRRRRRRRRKGGDDDSATHDDPPNTVVHVREAREPREPREPRDEKTEAANARDEVRSVRGSTRLEAKRQRRRDGREAGRRRAPILSEAEFLARREAVDRAMVVREHTDRIQIGVLEDGVLVEHFVTSAGSGSLVGNVFLGRVQNVLPSMEAAFVDIGRGRNAVLYAGEVDWDAAGLDGKARKIEQALSTGDSVLVQVTKDPVGHKGARLTTQISLPGRFLVYVSGGGATGISRKLPENERRRLKDVLKRIVPEDAGVIIRTASEGISEEELGRDVRRLQAQWQVIKEKSDGSVGKKSGAPTLLYEEPDLLVKVVRDLFTEDFTSLVVQGETAWETIDAYVRHVAPELLERVRRHVGPKDVFAEHRIDEQLLKALDRKVWLPSGGYLVIDRTEAMTVIDVNTGKYTGSGGNLEETVTRNNLESAEEIVRQLRLRDIGGIIVIDFIDMVLESNRDLVLRRLTECLGRDRTRHQVAEVTSLGLVQMTRKRVGTGLLEAFSHTCEHCKGRGVMVSTEPNVKAAAGGGQPQQPPQPEKGQGNGGGGGRNRNRNRNGDGDAAKDSKDSTRDEGQNNGHQSGQSRDNGNRDNGNRDNGRENGQRDGGHKDNGRDNGHRNDRANGRSQRAAAAAADEQAKAPVRDVPEVVSAPAAAPAQRDGSEPLTGEPGDRNGHARVESTTPLDSRTEAALAEPEPVSVPAAPRRRARRAASRPAGPPVGGPEA
ncbi:translation initiation factor IF-2 N-terminal domain-containing protein [Actinokineospora spheciospongiae]|uniref:translation initiation factor IF-2 N-terminal domain-containing protein n=1 Tax=Actinokineospora spheciospongiae TaxID=909613 RepID=UPI000D71CFF0|nr:translation initiation factor IF-2 N-terminal domain-containing protein [Actinokineospora spheciospongiae]PWW56141.1 ribonuclease E [Actinokineospora spheciospongiae]